MILTLWSEMLMTPFKDSNKLLNTTKPEKAVKVPVIVNSHPEICQIRIKILGDIEY